jgi:hypothetical protein
MSSSKPTAAAARALPSPEELCSAFIAELRQSLSSDDLETIVERNKENGPETCASHDFCDPNQCMLEAWEKLGHALDLSDHEQLSLTDQAWTLARLREFSATAPVLTQAADAEVQASSQAKPLDMQTLLDSALTLIEFPERVNIDQLAAQLITMGAKHLPPPSQDNAPSP